MKANRSTLMRGTVMVAVLLLAASLVGPLQAQEGPPAERIMEATDVGGFYTPASGALFVLRSAPYSTSPTSETLVRSDDGGTTWRDVNLPPGPMGDNVRRAVEVDPLNHTVIYATGQDGLYKSDDDAASWRVVLPHQLPMGQVAVSRADTGLVYVTEIESGVGNTPTRILRSRDGGETWDPILDATCARVRLFPDPTKPARIVAALNCMPDRPAALYLSEDQGTTWATWQTWPGADETRGPALAGPLLAGGEAGGPEQFYVAFSAYSLEDGLPLFLTRDAGKGWEQRRIRPREEVPPPSPKWQGGKFWSYISALAADPQAPERLYVGLYGSPQPLRMSNDAGASWNTLALPTELQNVTALALGADRQNLYVATSFVRSSYGVEGVYRVRLP
jgi:photosystem II stability/assembly factor-like uncharacterized protein